MFIKRNKKTLGLITAVFLIAFLQAGCASRTYQVRKPVYRPVYSPAYSPASPNLPKISSYTFPHPAGMYYRVERGQTLWAIGKNFGVSVKSLQQHNRIANPRKLSRGKRMFIPAKSGILPTATYKARQKRWKYIIIHHSATDVGAAKSFDRGHRRRGFRWGLGYHFVIDNGTQGTKDGDIEISRRWFYQMDGAHCQAGGMNRRAIGICLVGNFNKESPSEKQLGSLVALIDILRQQYRIPLSNIKGHRDVPGAATECPGKNFPWYRVKRELSQGSVIY